MNAYKYIIIGGGMTADAAAKGIREVDTDGSIAIFSSEPVPPYYRPPLSKSLWLNESANPDSISCGTNEQQVDLFCDTTVVQLNPQEHQLRTNEGEMYEYERLLLATGGRPRKLDIDTDDGSIMYYRTLDDYIKLSLALEPDRHIVLIGGGFIGMELASALKQNNMRITMIFPELHLGRRILPSSLSQQLTEYYQQHGVTIHAEAKPISMQRRDDGICEVLLNDNTSLVADLVVAGVGIQPSIELAVAAGLEVDNGIHVDEQGRTHVDDLFAAGDVANFYNATLDQRMRVEHADNATSMGKLVGRNMAGKAEAYNTMPFFYSDFFDLGYEAVGNVDTSLDTFTLLEDVTDKGPIFYMDGDKVKGVTMWNCFGHIDEARELISAARSTSHEELKRWAENTLEQK